MLNIYRSLFDRLQEHESAVMLTSFHAEGGEILEKTLITHDQTGSVDWPADLQLAIEAARSSHKLALWPDGADQQGQRTVIMPYAPPARLLVLGGGTISAALVPWAAACGFSVAVADDRWSFCNPERFPQAEQAICAPFREALELMKPSADDYVVIVTRGHRYDHDCLRVLLPIQPRYLGMIGSQRRVRDLKKLLLAEGFTEAALAQVCAPIGFNIGGISPEEIAVSILAQLICQRRMGQSSLPTEIMSKKNAFAEDIDYELLAYLAAGQKERCALVTVIAARGSVPRGPGAQMLVLADGSLIGSIGGGCSEAEVIEICRDVLDDGRCRLHRVDMTGDVASSEGMVCGGILDVFMEAIG